MKPLRAIGGDRPLAVRSTLVAIAVALAISALGSVAFTLALRDTFASGMVTFATFGGLAALTAGVLAWELASSRVCPRCGLENAPPLGSCARCGYDLRLRPRFACSEGHRLAYGEGLCDCGRRLLPLRPAPVAGIATRLLRLAVACVVVLLLLAFIVGLVAR